MVSQLRHGKDEMLMKFFLLYKVNAAKVSLRKIAKLHHKAIRTYRQSLKATLLSGAAAFICRDTLHRLYWGKIIGTLKK